MEIGANRLTATMLPDHSLRSLALVLGDMPPGDVPGAWWSSTYPDVIEAYGRFKADKKAWSDKYNEFLNEAGLSSNCQYMVHAGQTFVGVIPKVASPTTVAPRWLRFTKNRDLLIPRKRTQAEKAGPVLRLFEELEHIPQASEYMPGIPTSMYVNDKILPIHFRKPAQAVLAFVSVPPEGATELFEVGQQWSRMKISTFHLLRERQQARSQVK